MLPSRRVMTRFQSVTQEALQSPRPPLSSSGLKEVRRRRQSSFSAAASNPPAPALVFHPGYTTSSRSPHFGATDVLGSVFAHRSAPNAAQLAKRLFPVVTWRRPVQSFRYKHTGWDRLFAATQVLISLVNPVCTRRVKDVKVNRVRQCFRPVRHVRRDGEHLARVHYHLFAVNPEL